MVFDIFFALCILVDLLYSSLTPPPPPPLPPIRQFNIKYQLQIKLNFKRKKNKKKWLHLAWLYHSFINTMVDISYFFLSFSLYLSISLFCSSLFFLIPLGIADWYRCVSKRVCPIVTWIRNSAASAITPKKENLWVLYGAHNKVLGWFGKIIVSIFHFIILFIHISTFFFLSLFVLFTSWKINSRPYFSFRLLLIFRVFFFSSFSIFFAQQIAYMVFLMLFSYTVLVKMGPSPTWQEVYSIAYITTLGCEKIREVISSEPVAVA